MAQQTIITIPTVPANSGLGSPLANAFLICNDNFDELYARAQENPPPTLVGSIGDEAGMYAYDSTYFYYCFANYDGSSTIWAQVTQVGNISLPEIQNGNSNVSISTSDGNVTISVDGVVDVATVTSTGIDVDGNVTATYFLGDGSLLTGLPATYGNANVATYLPTYSGTLSPSAIYTNGYYYANGSPFTGSGGSGTYSDANVAAYLPTYGGSLGGTLTTNAQPNITTIGALSALTVNGIGNIILTPVSKNITMSPTFGGTVTINPDGVGSIDNMVIGAAAPEAGSFTTVSASGNVTGQYFIGDGSQLTNLPVGNYSNANVAAFLPTYTGNVASGNLFTTGDVSATGNITGSYIIGNGSQLTGITSSSNYTNANVAAFLPTYTGNLSAGNISVVGTTTSSVVGNVSGVVTGQLNGLVNGVNTVYGAWDFGWINTNLYTNPTQWIFAQTSAGNVDMGTVTAPASYEIDIGTIF